MCRVLKLEIKETEAELESLLKQQKTASGFERIQVLYLLKTHQTSSVQHIATVLGRRRITVQRWLKHYREAGLQGLLEKRKSPGRPKIIPVDVRSQLKKELCEPEGFKSYEEIRTWLRASQGIEASYKVVHEVVRYKLKAKLKTPRPCSVKQNEGVKEDFKKNCHLG